MTVPVAVIVTVPIVVGLAHVRLAPHSYNVIVGLVVQVVRLWADPSILSTLEAIATLENRLFVLTIVVINPGWYDNWL
jgi:hypothetical protein